MITSDTHMHSCFSSDSLATPESMVQGAILKGLKTICFTDHMDIDFPIESGGGFIFNTNIYTATIAELREKYKDKIEILTGVEYGLQPYLKKQYRQLTQQNQFDFIIGSSHLVNKQDPYHANYWKGITTQQGMESYFTAIYSCVNTFDDYDVYGHIDYAIRYAPDQNKGFCYESYRELIDSIFSSLIRKGKGIELNTSGIRYGLRQPHPQIDILKRYREMGGEIITIGTDAHKPEQIAYELNFATELLKDVGFKYYTVFKNRKPHFLAL